MKPKLNNTHHSEAITWLRFPLIFFIIMLHCYSSVALSGSHTTYFNFIYPFSLWLGETGVPGFFFISGFLFFLSKKSYTQKLKTRFHTLFIPYILWNALLLGLYLIAFLLEYPQDPLIMAILFLYSAHSGTYETYSLCQYSRLHSIILLRTCASYFLYQLLFGGYLHHTMPLFHKRSYFSVWELIFLSFT